MPDGQDRGGGIPPRNITIKGKRTSIRLDETMWQSLEVLARRRGLGRDELLNAIDDGRRAGESLTAAVRRQLFEFLRSPDSIPGDPLERRFAELEPAKIGRTVREEGDDYEELVRFDPDFLLERRCDLLAPLYRAWWDERDHVGVVREAAFHPEPLACLKEAGLVNLIDVTPENPLNFVLRRVAEPSAIRFGRIVGNRLEQFPLRLHGEVLALVFHRVRQEGRAEFHLVRQRFRSALRVYERLVLPLADDHGRVGVLMTAVLPYTMPTRLSFSVMSGLTVPHAGLTDGGCLV